MSIPRHVVRIADGSRVPQLTVKLADNQTPAQATLKVAEEGDRAQYTVKIAEEGDRAQMTVALDGYVQGSAYAARVLALSPIAYYQLNGDATDSSGNGFNGLVTGATFGAVGIGDDNTAASFDGSGDFIDIHAMAAAWNGNAGSMIAWGKSAAWADSTVRSLVSILASSENSIWMQKSAALNGLTFRRSDSNDDLTVNSSALAGSSAWFSVGLTWSVAANALKAYINGAQVGSTLTGLQTVAGTPGAATTTIGASNTSGATGWIGDLAHVAIFNRVLTGAEMLSLGVL